MITISRAIELSWAALGLVWALGLISTKRIVRVQSAGSRLFELALFALGFAMMAGNWFRYGWLGQRFTPYSNWIAGTGLALTLAGCVFAIWARVMLGSNWSGRATVKQGHTLITKGPYALSRHPIYTGLLVAVLGTAIVGGAWRYVLGLTAIMLAIMVKIGQEERLMMQTFPQVYAQYRQRVKALIPGII